MPVEWLKPLEAPASPGASALSGDVVAQLRVRPHQSMTPAGFVLFMGATAGMIALPLLAVLGTPVLWGLLPFLALALWGLWHAIEHQRRRAAGLAETLTLGRDRVELVRDEPRRAPRTWKANPYWVSVHLHPGDKPVEHYLTLKGGGREVEIGAFLTPDERLRLFDELQEALARVRSAH